MISSCLLPVRISTERSGLTELERAKRLIESLKWSWSSRNYTLRVVVVCPLEEFEDVKSALSGGSGISVQVFAEKDVLSSVERSDIEALPGWWRQQIIKIWAGSRLMNGFFYTLDSDVVALVPLDEFTHIVSGKAISGWRDVEEYPYKWTENTYKLLGLDTDDLPKKTFGVTPNVLHSDLCTNTIIYLNQVSAVPLVFLAQAVSDASFSGPESPWTEYDLYSATSFAAGILGDYHVGPWDSEAKKRPKLMEDQLFLDSVSRRSFFLNHKNVVWPRKVAFAVVQSSNCCSRDEVEALYNHIEYIFHRNPRVM